MTLCANSLTIAGRLDGVSVSFERGEITAICGPNGAGKSSLLQAMAGLLEADSGETRLGDTALKELHPRERAKRLGYLPQHAEIAWDVPVRTIVELGRMPHRDQRAEPVDAAISALDLQAFENRRAQSLSGGETARVLLARVLAGEPEWILADEPLAALDLSHQLALLGHLRKQAESGAGIVLVVHDLALAINHADRVLVLDNGRIVADGAPNDALAAANLANVWGVNAHWIGEKGAQALVARQAVMRK